MRAMLIVALLSMSLTIALPATGTAQSDAERNAIVQVIQGQLAAFQADNGALAFGFASPGIQRMFGTPERFMAMVRTGYAPVYRPRSAEFLDLNTGARGPVQEVLFIGPDGVPVIARYYMEQQPDGSWRINGVSLHETDDTTA